MFSNEEVQTLLDSVDTLPIKKGSTLGSIEDYRVSHIKWIPKHKDVVYGWIYEKMWKWIEKANEENWKFDLTGFRNDAQYTEYYMYGHYDWHLDLCGKDINHRKVSLTCNLNENYEGGDFQFKFGTGHSSIELEKGDAVIFPSFFMHRVTPVTKGIRKSLVQWTSGKPFK